MAIPNPIRRGASGSGVSAGPAARVNSFAVDRRRNANTIQCITYAVATIYAYYIGALLHSPGLTPWVRHYAIRGAMTPTDDATALDDSLDVITDALLTASRLLVALSASSIALVDENITIPQFRTLVILS